MNASNCAMDIIREESKSAHAPRRLVSDAKHALDLFGHTVPGGGEHVHDVEPIAERGPCVLHRRSGGRIDLVAATLIGSTCNSARGDRISDNQNDCRSGCANAVGDMPGSR